MKEIFFKFKKKHFNFLPGPVKISKFSKKCFNFPIISQRNPDFEFIYFDLIENLKLIIDNPNGEIFVIYGSGTLAMEASIDNFIDCNSNPLVLSCGKFGDRFSEILELKNIKHDKLSFFANRRVDYQLVKAKIEENIKKGKPYTHLLFQATETSTGIGVDLYKIKELKEMYNLFLICDGISHILSNYFSQNFFNIDVLLFSSQKGLSSLPGISFISLLKGVLEKIVENKSYYINLKNYKKKLIPFTPPIINVYNLWLNSIIIRKRGVPDIVENNIFLRNKFSKFIKEEIGLVEYPYEPSNSILVCEMNNSTSFVERLYNKYNISVANGQGELKNKVFRVAFMGIENKEKDFNFLIKVIRKELKGKPIIL
ncbi:MAG: aminotransferase class V-fold PLP-dependent enzyme [Spirochaetes bacterium]|nr:aminotransferase class V-fold PLP-dependent enzyme [Spirochaetota bacterium]